MDIWDIVYLEQPFNWDKMLETKLKNVNKFTYDNWDSLFIGKNRGRTDVLYLTGIYRITYQSFKSVQ